MTRMTHQSMSQWVKREVKNQRETITGVVLTKPILKFFSAGNVAEQWVVDVAIGSNRDVRNVPIKPGPAGGYNYAQRDATVKLIRNLDQKYQIVGPGDRKIGITKIKTYTPGNPTPVTETNLGQTSIRRPYEFYKGGLPGSPGTGLYGIQVGYPLEQKLDGDGNVIP